ncbi:HipA family kinase [Rhizobium sp. BK650]|uniref:HipA family kinase n=1 Tax=Rhizobium sp. BK650 TaxID=2586990 RepID=UPI0028A6A4F5|nr:HipA family kinase [Rhizobium sp. BK650]
MVLATSTRPLLVVTDVGTALVKYMGNRAGLDALVTELLAAELAGKIGLRTPDFAVVEIPDVETTDPLVTVQGGPAFFSRWEQAQSLSPNSKLLANLRTPSDLALLVAFDTWIRNKDRFAEDANGAVLNYDNILFVPDKRRTKLLVIDHSHAFAETSLDDEINDSWATEQTVYGLFKEFAPMLTRGDVKSALDTLCGVAIGEIRNICLSPPAEWGFTASTANRLTDLLVQRAKRMSEWLPDAIFDQMELDLGGKEA